MPDYVCVCDQCQAIDHMTHGVGLRSSAGSVPRPFMLKCLLYRLAVVDFVVVGILDSASNSYMFMFPSHPIKALPNFISLNHKSYVLYSMFCMPEQ